MDNKRLMIIKSPNFAILKPPFSSLHKSYRLVRRPEQTRIMVSGRQGFSQLGTSNIHGWSISKDEFYEY